MTTKQLGRKEQEIMSFLHQRIFDHVLQSPAASEKLKQGVRLTIMRMEQRDALMRQEGFDRFEEALEEFRVRFNDQFLREP